MDSGTPGSKPPVGTAQLKKLGIVPGARWRVDSPPSNWRFEDSPEASLEAAEDDTADVVLAFVTAAEQVEPTIIRLEGSIFPAGALWLAWPRRAGGHSSDITDGVVRQAALARSLVDTKVAAIDADWSGLKLVWRVSARG